MNCSKVSYCNHSVSIVSCAMCLISCQQFALTLFLPLFFVPKMFSAYYTCYIYSDALQNIFSFEWKFFEMVLVTLSRSRAATPIYGKNPLKSSYTESEGQWPWTLVSSIWDVGTIKQSNYNPRLTFTYFIASQICFLMHLNGNVLEMLIFQQRSR